MTHVKINEVESQGGVPGDWVELVNLSAAELDISGYVIKDDDDTHIGTIPSGSVIPANGYLAIDEATLGYGLGGNEQARLYARTVPHCSTARLGLRTQHRRGAAAQTSRHLRVTAPAPRVQPTTASHWCC